MKSPVLHYLFNTTLRQGARFVNFTGEVEELADAYVNQRVVGKSSYLDCTHIALASCNKVDILASWNFKHVVSLDWIRGYNSVNLKLGYPLLEIRTPREIMKYD